MSIIKELREKQAKLVSDAREELDKITDDTSEDNAKEIEDRYDALMAEHDKIEARIKREQELEVRQAVLDESDVEVPRGENRRVEPENDTPIEERQADAFRSYLRQGLTDMPAEQRQLLREMRAQAAGTDSAGGYTVPQGFSNELVVSMKMWGPMLDPGITRELVTASGNQIDWPTLDDTANQAYRLGENTEATNEGDLAFGNKQLDAYKYASGPILVSSELLQDSAFDVEQIVRDAMAERFGRKVNLDLTTGDGTGDPNGIVTASTLGETAASNSAISFDDLIELQHSVDPAYRSDPSVRWMFNDATLKLLRKIKDGDGNYIWQPADVRTGSPASILGSGYAINQAVASLAASAITVVYGVMNKYIVRRVREVAIRRLVERYAEFDQVGFIGFARYDGELMNVAAVKHLVHPA